MEKQPGSMSSDEKEKTKAEAGQYIYAKLTEQQDAGL